ncbi:hypothetical protein ABZ345_34110 [Lentzea sp. NPDC005914]|uniref:hypothetical protein n=1 Tax=Lentzea sp. NPDC005914 TaxID=3154572 RepID=UPI0033DA75FB
MADLLIPASACEHPRDKLRCDVRNDGVTVRILAQCLRCASTWNERDLPEDVADKLLELAEMGCYREGRL